MQTVTTQTVEAVAPLAPPAPPEKLPDHNRTGIDYRKPMPRPKVSGPAIDYHIHLHAARQAPLFIDAAGHYGFERFVTMTPLDEALTLHRDWPDKFRFIAIPNWRSAGPDLIDHWLRAIEAFYNIGSRIVKFWCAPAAIGDRGWRLDSEMFAPLFKEAVARKMAIMTHIGDPDTWYRTKYADHAKYGGRKEHYRMWENILAEYGTGPWIGAHLGGNPENLPRLQWLLDSYPNLLLDCSATKWMVRELSTQRDAARDFFIRNQDRILFGTDQVTSDDRSWDFLASRFWVHRKLWETAYIGQTPIYDPDVPEDQQPIIRGLALPDQVLQKLYHDNTMKLLEGIGMGL